MTHEGFIPSSAPGGNMLTEDITIEELATIRYEEGWEDGRKEGRVEGHEKGLEKGEEQKARAIAKNLLTEGSTPEFVQKITGLDMQLVQELAAK